MIKYTFSYLIQSAWLYTESCHIYYKLLQYTCQYLLERLQRCEEYCLSQLLESEKRLVLMKDCLNYTYRLNSFQYLLDKNNHKYLNSSPICDQDIE